jgi:hypothetical protein
MDNLYQNLSTVQLNPLYILFLFVIEKLKCEKVIVEVSLLSLEIKNLSTVLIFGIEKVNWTDI